jgi:hypothetical protein
MATKSKRTSKIAAILPTPEVVQEVATPTPKRTAKIAPAVFEKLAAKIEKQAAAAPDVPVKAPAAPRGQGIGAMVKDLIAQGLSNDDILIKVKEQFPTAATNKGCVSWYRSDMKKKAAKTEAS